MRPLSYHDCGETDPAAFAPSMARKGGSQWCRPHWTAYVRASRERSRARCTQVDEDQVVEDQVDDERPVEQAQELVGQAAQRRPPAELGRHFAAVRDASISAITSKRARALGVR